MSEANTATEESTSDAITCFYEMEDELAQSMGHQRVQQEFSKEAAFLRQALESIVTGEYIEPIPTSLLLNTANMRRLSRYSQYLAAQQKQEAAKQLEQVEAQFLELQNANSEIQHLQKEVRKCLDFSAGDEDLNMVTEEQFYAEAPESISEPEKTKTDEHARTNARLKWELMQRKQLFGVLNDQETRKSVLQSDIEGKEQRLRTLKPAIANLLEAAKPIQEILGSSEQDSTLD